MEFSGTVRVKNIMSGSVGSVPEELTAAEDRLFFTADDGTGRQRVISDGTALGTHNNLPGGVDARGLTHDKPGPNYRLLFVRFRSVRLSLRRQYPGIDGIDGIQRDR